MRKLRQPGDYFTHNRTGASPPRIHTFTVESNQKVEKENFSKKKRVVPELRERTVVPKPQERTVVPEQRERTVRDSKQENSEIDTEKDSGTQSTRERADIQDYA